MPPRENRNQNLLDDFILTHDDFGKLIANPVVRLLATLHGGEIILGRGNSRGLISHEAVPILMSNLSVIQISIDPRTNWEIRRGIFRIQMLWTANKSPFP